MSFRYCEKLVFFWMIHGSEVRSDGISKGSRALSMLWRVVLCQGVKSSEVEGCVVTSVSARKSEEVSVSDSDLEGIWGGNNIY